MADPGARLRLCNPRETIDERRGQYVRSAWIVSIMVLRCLPYEKAGGRSLGPGQPSSSHSDIQTYRPADLQTCLREYEGRDASCSFLQRGTVATRPQARRRLASSVFVPYQNLAIVPIAEVAGRPGVADNVRRLRSTVGQTSFPQPSRQVAPSGPRPPPRPNPPWCLRTSPLDTEPNAI